MLFFVITPFQPSLKNGFSYLSLPAMMNAFIIQNTQSIICNAYSKPLAFSNFCTLRQGFIMESIISYEYCLKERIVQAVECRCIWNGWEVDFESIDLLKKVSLPNDLKEVLEKRKLFFEVDKRVSVYPTLYHQISMLTETSDFREAFTSLSHLVGVMNCLNRSFPSVSTRQSI